MPEADVSARAPAEADESACPPTALAGIDQRLLTFVNDLSPTNVLCAMSAANGDESGNENTDDIEEDTAECSEDASSQCLSAATLGIYSTVGGQISEAGRAVSHLTF